MIEEVLPKGKKFTLKNGNVDDYTHLTGGTWTTDEHTTIIADLIRQP
ncbi:hypothetical protein [Mesoflavibacter zeaxanthinifaciens]